MKKCSKCAKGADVVKFNKNLTKKDGLNNWCNTCRHDRYLSDYPLKIRSNILRNNFGITMEEYKAMEIQQENICKICKEVCSTGKVLAVDHDHKTGKIRGLLCNSCNTGLGKFFDREQLLLEAVRYLSGIQED